MPSIVSQPARKGLASRLSAVELPTLVVAVTVYGGWIMLTALHASVPLFVLSPAGAILIAWHGSLQHETIHGHPTGNPVIDGAVGFAPLSLWLPYALYRRSHIAHHATANVTDPLDDPESHYLARPGGIAHLFARIEATLAGRLVLGPPIRIGSFLWRHAVAAARHPAEGVRIWLPHGLAVILILSWLDHVGLPLSTYVLAFVYPGTALSLLRSFAEHRSDPDRAARAALVEKPGPFGLLFLNNNLHAVHHANPRLAWYKLPARYTADRHLFAGAPFYRSYGAVAARYLFRPNDMLVHPDHRPVR